MTLPGLFVVGTDTGVGKTRVASSIARNWTRLGKRVGVLKPVATGSNWRSGQLRSDDADALVAAIGGDAVAIPYEKVVPIQFEEPLAPTVAARRAGMPLGRDRVERSVGEALDWWETRADVMVVEGVGGLLCPLAEGMTVADLAIRLDFPLVVVGRRGLGTLNHVMITVEAALRRSLRVAGVVLNGSAPPTDAIAEATNAAELARWLGEVVILADWAFNPDGVESAAGESGDNLAGWYDRARSPRAVP